jgi:isoleucyl-tRNA synthetase
VDDFLFIKLNFKYMTDENTNQKSPQALREEAVLAFWAENNIFEKTLEKNKDGKKFVFFEGPPTANAKPALHHLEARAFKDVMPRYKTMQGFNVPRRAGWDTHGLPVELQIEKKLGLTSKKDIEKYGVAQFNKECKDSVFEYIGDWEKFTDRIGYWVDKERAYYTFDTNYIESLWSIVGRVNEQDLLYKDYKVVPWCPRCGTGLSSHELAQGYEDVKDLSVYAKFKIIGFDNAYFIAWTTTPWTLPGNVALAVGADIDYVEVRVDTEIFVVAKERVENLFETGTYEIIAEHKGSEMVGMQYEPLYPYLKNIITGPEVDKMDKAYKVYVADFVTTTDGTGIVHTAVMYGADDFVLGTSVGLPKFHTVDETGHFVKGTDFLEGRFVKDEDVAIDIIKDLAHRGLLFKKEKYEHSYPHCWRCKTPLIYYARDSWYIAMSKLRDKMVDENKNINWEPAHIREGRFGEWIDGIKDWAISRERYWGTPLPIWLSSDGDKIVADSFDTLKKYTKKSGNKYFMMRHGEADHNVLQIFSCDPKNPHHLTELGKNQVIETAQKLKNENIDVIISSPFIRSNETANIVAEIIGFDKAKIQTDARIGEYGFGVFNMKGFDEYVDYRAGHEFDMKFSVPDGESLQDAKNRFAEFLYEIDSNYENKNIFISTHGIAFELIHSILECLNESDSAKNIRGTFRKIENGHLESFELVKLPHNQNYELDPHKPYIDEIVLYKDGKEFRRVKEVMDVWFDSGAMPFAQDHYMFKKQNIIEKLINNNDDLNYPADFISEAIDQTRGWFYTLHAIGALTGKGKAYKNVICLGHLLDANGKKMSKSIGNIVEPWAMMDKYGADSLRLWMYSVNQPGDSKNFDEKTVKETEGKIITLLYNVLSFYDLYRDASLEGNNVPNSNNVLDQWIINKLNELIASMTNNLDGYKLLEPVREMREFIGDLSTWYLRRSRDRLKDGDVDAKKTLYYVLKTMAKLMAPFAPFTAEDIWQKLRLELDALSAHLTQWPVAEKVDEVVLAEMVKVREVCTEGNALRKKLNIAVKQPLASFTIVGELSNIYFEIIMDELNVKNILIGTEFVYDTEITPELKREGNYRELVRALQDLRKETGLTPDDVISLKISDNAQDLLAGFESDLKKTVQISDISFIDGENEISIEGQQYKVSIQK